MVRSVDPRRAVEFGPEVPEIDATDPASLAGLVGRAVEAAGQLAAATGDEVSGGLRAVADALDAEIEPLAMLADAETALGVPRLRGEIGRTTAQLRRFADLIERGAHLGQRASDLPEGGAASTLRKVNVPLGVVVVFAASNFPFAFSVAGGDTAAALAAGNAVIVKAHYGHPQTSARVGEIVADALRHAGLPSAAVQVVHGSEAIGRELVLHPDVAAVGFTGSTSGGRALSDLAASRSTPIPVYAEQGSINPVVVAPSAADDLETEARQLAGSVLLGSGQFCTKPGLIVAPAAQVDALATLLRREMSAAGEMYLLTAKIRDAYLAAVEELRCQPGTDAWVGESAGAPSVPACLLVADAATYLTTPALRAELFGPATVLVGVRDLGELGDLLAGLEGSLTATVHGDPTDPWVSTAVARLAPRVGRLVFGGVPTGVTVDAAMHHGGPYPAASSGRYTSVGDDAIARFLRPICYQDFPAALLPTALLSTTQDAPIG